MPAIRQSIAWWCFVPDLMTPEALLRTAVEIGYEAVELVPQQHWQAVKDHGLKIASIGGHTALTDGMNLGIKGYEKVRVKQGPGKGLLIIGDAMVIADKTTYKDHLF